MEPLILLAAFLETKEPVKFYFEDFNTIRKEK